MAPGEQHLEVSVTIAAELDTVWSFLSDPAKFVAWMTAMPGGPPVAGSLIEPKMGGKVRICYPGGACAVGEFTAIEDRRRVAFTWGYDPDLAGTGVGPGACVVEVSLARLPEGTRVTLRQSGAMADAVRKGHEAGWKHYLSMLAAMGASAQHEPTVQRIFAEYFAAWNEHDEGMRRNRLAACCEPGVKVRTMFACTDTIDDLNAHIGNGLKHMPGAALTPAGPAQHLHGNARIAWVVKFPDGSTPFRGENVARLSARGKIAELVGFPA